MAFIDDNPPGYTKHNIDTNITNSTAVIVQFHHKAVTNDNPRQWAAPRGPAFGIRTCTKTSAVALSSTITRNQVLELLSLQATKIFGLGRPPPRRHWRVLRMNLDGNILEIVDEGSWQAAKQWLERGQGRLCFYYADEETPADLPKLSRKACAVQ